MSRATRVYVLECTCGVGVYLNIWGEEGNTVLSLAIGRDGGMHLVDDGLSTVCA